MAMIDKYNDDTKEPVPTIKDMEKVLKCPDCGAEGEYIGYENEEHFCKKCGRVLDFAIED